MVPAWDTHTQCLVALKRQPAESDDAVREMVFFDSLRGAVEPTNVLRMYASFVHDKTLTLAFEYMRSTVADEWERAQGRLFPVICQRYCAQLFNGMKTLHARKIAHLDISLKNCLVDPVDNTLKICDLGLEHKYDNRRHRSRQQLSLIHISEPTRPY